MSEADLQNYFNNHPFFKNAIQNMAREKFKEVTSLILKSYNQTYITQIDDKNQQLNQLMITYASVLRELQSLQWTYAGFGAGKDAEALALSELMEALYNSPFVKDINYNSSVVRVVFMAPARNVDTDVIQNFMAKRYVNETLRCRILEELFIKDDYELWSQSALILPLFGQQLKGVTTGLQTEWGLPNIHHTRYNCFGNSAVVVANAARDKNYTCIQRKSDDTWYTCYEFYYHMDRVITAEREEQKRIQNERAAEAARIIRESQAIPPPIPVQDPFTVLADVLDLENHDPQIEELRRQRQAYIAEQERLEALAREHAAQPQPQPVEEDDAPEDPWGFDADEEEDDDETN
jgi:tRNA A37 threonylcarbamoyladenosine modification protein TsaB